LVIFQGGISASGTQLERLVAEAQNASTLDALAAAASSGAFQRGILVTEDTGLAAAARSIASQAGTSLPLAIEPAPLLAPGEMRFSFGENLRAVCKAHGVERVVYAGGGSMPLVTPAALADLALAATGSSPCVVSNNLFSADIVAFQPASALDLIEPPANDNDLAWLLHYRAGLPHATAPKTLAFNFDLDTPGDLAALHLATQSPPLDSQLGAHLRAVLASVPAELPILFAVLDRAYKAMATRRAQVLLAGRVSSWTWRRLEANLPCQTRIFSEERGMRASGREARGEVCSLLGLYADIAGIKGLMGALEQVCDAAFLDTRVLFAHRRLSPTHRDRYASDAMLPEEVSDRWVRELTEAALAAPIPIVLGGHSLISGGVWALSERVRGSASAAAG
jgi:CTP:molybdopterin cytidylyltransferase MocA